MLRNIVTLVSILFFTCAASAVLIQEVPDKEGATVKGLVSCGDEPVANCQVSDGVEVTLTDANGHYWLNSAKKCGYVFICNPEGYKNTQDGRYPEFYKFLKSTSVSESAERVDFALQREGNGDHVVMFLADPQLCSKNNDKEQFTDHVVPDFNNVAKSYQDQGKDVYLLTLGDLSYNSYYYKANFKLPQVKSYLGKLKPTAVYHCMGNHDNDPDVVGDWDATLAYRKNFGPTYYSFNAGKIHYLIIDNIEYLNPGASKDDNSYEVNITNDVLKWMVKDLANVDKSKTVVVVMHAPLFKRQQLSGTGELESVAFRYTWGQKFADRLTGFKDVRVFTGHAHTNRITRKNQFTEYGVGCCGGDLYWTGKYVDGNIVCRDGTPGSYRVMEVTGDNITTYNKSIGFDSYYQFRAYDLNNCNITASRFCPAYKSPQNLETFLTSGTDGKSNPYGYNLSDYYVDGTPRRPNEILVNVFTFGPEWKIEMFEDGRALDVKRVKGYDPYSIISDLCQRLQNNSTAAGDPDQISTLFKATASSATSAVTIKVTDEYGNEYVEVMNRPKEFSIANYKIGSGEGQYASVGDIFVEDLQDYPSVVEYYNLNGVKIANPTSGIYIRREGNKFSKVLVK